MAFTSLPNVGEQTRRTYRAAVAINDNDLGKPVKLSAADTVALCAAGEEIYGFIDSVEEGTDGGDRIVGVVVEGRARVTLSGSAAVGTLVEGATNTAAGSAIGQNWGIVQVHVPDITSTTTLRDTTFPKNWRVISGAGTTGTDAVVESC